ncbi:MAG: DUF928 domain-containing protein [Microcystaceae cyanobacterium]
MVKIDLSQKSLTSSRKPSLRIAFRWLLSATATACFSAGLILSALAGTNSESSAETRGRVRNANPPAETRRGEQTSVWAALWELLKSKRSEPALTSRGKVCEIAPGLLGEKNVIWSDRPLFLWQGTVPSLEIRLYSPFSPDREQEVLWSQTVSAQSQTAKFQSVTYTGEALQPGKTYDWELVVSSSRRQRFTFQVMESQERDRLASELTERETQLKAAGATTEEIALQWANYFAQRGLWSDALQEIYSVKNPSVDLTRNVQEILSYLCESSDIEISQ